MQRRKALVSEAQADVARKRARFNIYRGGEPRVLPITRNHPRNPPDARYSHTFIIAFSVRTDSAIGDVTAEELWAGLSERIVSLAATPREIMEAAMPEPLETEDRADETSPFAVCRIADYDAAGSLLSCDDVTHAILDPKAEGAEGFALCGKKPRKKLGRHGGFQWMPVPDPAQVTCGSCRVRLIQRGLPTTT